MGAHQHLVAGLGIGVPALFSLDIHWPGLQSLERVGAALFQALVLLLFGDIQPVLDHLDARGGQHPFELRRIDQELLLLLGAGEAHDLFHARAIVPGAVEDHPFAGRGQVAHIALEPPLAVLAAGGLGQGDDAGGPGRQMFDQPLDRAVLAGGVAAFEQDDGLVALVHRPDLAAHQLDGQFAEGFVIVVVGVAHASSG